DHDGSEFAKLREEFGIPDGDWGKIFSVSVHPNGEESVKVYDMDFSKYDIPELPKGAELGCGGRTELGVASVWSKGSSGTGSGPSSDVREVYFRASREAV